MAEELAACRSYADICAASNPYLTAMCFACARHKTLLYHERVCVPDCYPADASALLSAYLSNGTITVCAECRGHLLAARKPGVIANQVAALAMSMGGGGGDMPGWFLIGWLIEFAWHHTANPHQYASPHPALALALDLLDRYPIAELVAGETKGILNLATRDLGNRVGVTIAPEPKRLYLVDFYSLNKQKGNGKAGMLRVCAAADKRNVTLFGVVEVHDNKGGVGDIIADADKLYEYYQQFGFRQVGTRQGLRTVERRPERLAG